MRRLMRISCTLFLALLAGAVVSVVGSEVVAQVYMHDKEITSRIELSEDYGFGTLALFVMSLGFVIGFVFGAKASWNLTKRFA